MISKTVFAAIAGLTLMVATPSTAQDARVYAYEGAGNFCPAGLQPVTISGVICCGVPNAGSYQKAMMHASVRKHSHVKKHKHVKTHTHAKRHSHMSMHSHAKHHSH
ncbi:hypothetical protein [Algirhabdus cladophorae]|uniref:hypothetical protein n=1 Tax=Algirhabdus cladophorae TaxID=3377108 RepID=UPI003B8495CC